MNLIPSLLLLLPVSPSVASAASTGLVAAPVESVDDLVAAGRALLAEGKPAEALAKFEAAERLDPSVRTRQWTLRTWVAQGRINDALGEIDKLAKTEKGIEIDYLYGIAFAQRAKGYILEGVSGGIVAMAFDDAVASLKKATAAQPELYSDAFAALAECAWYARDLEVARAAADKDVALRPKAADAWLMLGKVAFDQYKVAQTPAEEGQPAPPVAGADKAWTAGRDAFSKAAELLASSSDPAARAKAAEASNQIGWMHVWKKQGDESVAPFAASIAADPAQADFATLRGSLTPEQFVATLERAEKQYETQNGKESTGDATLLWWLGYARYTAKLYDDAEAALTRAVAKAPAFTNSWYYIALSRYFRQDYDGAIAALRTHHGLSVDDAVASLKANETENLAILDYMAGMKKSKEQNVDAAFLSELQTLVAPDTAKYWNNLGLFLRDEGDNRIQRKTEISAVERKQIDDLYERSLAAYKKALELSPNDPNYLNDAAVVLDYNLDRELDQARAWYQKAAEIAEAEVARKDLDKMTRDLRVMALRDARNNLKKLDAKLEKRKKEKEGATPPPIPGGMSYGASR